MYKLEKHILIDRIICTIQELSHNFGVIFNTDFADTGAIWPNLSLALHVSDDTVSAGVCFQLIRNFAVRASISLVLIVGIVSISAVGSKSSGYAASPAMRFHRIMRMLCVKWINDVMVSDQKSGTGTTNSCLLGHNTQYAAAIQLQI